MILPGDHFCSLLHRKFDVALIIRLLARKILCRDLIDKILEAARALLQQLRVAFQCKCQGRVEVGHELEYPWGTFS